MSTPWRQKLIEAMQLNGLSSRTQEVYVVAVRQLADRVERLLAERDGWLRREKGNRNSLS